MSHRSEPANDDGRLCDLTGGVAEDVKGSVAARGVRKQLNVVFPERDRARRRESNPVIPTFLKQKT